MDKQIKPIIGTHNSMTFLRPAKWYGWFMIPFARCQKKTIIQQWEAGARVFDLRVKFDRYGNSHFAHGLYDCDDNQWISSMMEDARWYEKFLPFAYARRGNKRNEGNVKPKFNLFDFL